MQDGLGGDLVHPVHGSSALSALTKKLALKRCSGSPVIPFAAIKIPKRTSRCRIIVSNQET